MKKIICLVMLMVLLLSSFAFAGGVDFPSSPRIRVTLQSQDPDPVEPGQILTIKFKVENNGGESNNDVIVRLLPSFPFKMYGDSAEKNIGTLRAVSTGADAMIVEFKLKVDEEAVEGDTELELEVETGNGKTSYINNEFLINIQTKDAVLDIVSITSEPKQIAPGESAEISVLVKNLADSLLKDIKFKLDLDSSTLPLAPYQSSSERRISQLKSNYQNSMTFGIIAKPDAVPGLYKIPLTISYNDETGASYSVSDVLAVVIGDMPKVKAYIKKSSVLQADKEGKITLEIANAGNIDVKSAELILLPSEDYQLVGTSDYFYLGGIDSDDTESEEVDLYINKKVEVLNFPVQLKYYDANNKPFQQTFDLQMDLYSSSQLKKFGVIQNGNVWVWISLLVLGAGGYFYYTKYYKKKKKKV
ncbi:MAG: hypothetical protein KKA62_05475 [Nanoarchaeota archaeon]|nr:hypothetical protein [Nanoarchaeota archaeon]MBU1643529.1 hypothetical protein [Nanoarchaeota archaeon]MBU1977373.1 hypothetical protein [Nanoarchaeota archaeon]